ncbi:MAG: PilX N-terminal domain-containing pilus assembly protein [Planctomycetota bacterium]
MPHRQGGAALVVGMVLMLVLTIITLASARSTLRQEQMVGAIRESNFAFQAAEDVLRQVERRLRVAAESGTTGGLDPELWTSAGLEKFDCSGSDLVFFGDPSGWQSSPDPVANPASGSGNLTTRYRVIFMSRVDRERVSCTPYEELAQGSSQGESSYYLVLAYAEGPGGRGSALLTSTYYYED